MDTIGDEYNLMGWAFKNGDNLPANQYTKYNEVFSACVSAAIYSKAILEEIGLGGEEFFAYMEDVGQVIERVFWGIIFFSPESIVYHIGSGTSGSKYNEFKVKYASRNNLNVVCRNIPILQLMANALFSITGELY